MLSLDKYEYIKQLDIKTKMLASNISAGVYSSAFKGSGQDYFESRVYEQGDDLRRIDSRLSARDNQLYVKIFQEERQIDVLILADISKSMFSGLDKSSKYQSVTEITAMISSIANLNNDRVGLVLFDSEIVKCIPPNLKRETVSEIIAAFAESYQSNHQTNIAKALNYLSSTFKESAVVFLLSDFFDENYLPELKVANEQFDLIMVQIVDEIFNMNIGEGIVTVFDAETGKKQTISISNQAQSFENQALERTKAISMDNSVDLLQVAPSDSFITIFDNFMKYRNK